jgi:hypothetical protein
MRSVMATDSTPCLAMNSSDSSFSSREFAQTPLPGLSLPPRGSSPHRASRQECLLAQTQWIQEGFCRRKRAMEHGFIEADKPPIHEARRWWGHDVAPHNCPEIETGIVVQWCSPCQEGYGSPIIRLQITLSQSPHRATDSSVGKSRLVVVGFGDGEPELMTRIPLAMTLTRSLPGAAGWDPS